MVALVVVVGLAGKMIGPRHVISDSCGGGFRIEKTASFDGAAYCTVIDKVSQCLSIPSGCPRRSGFYCRRRVCSGTTSKCRFNCGRSCGIIVEVNMG